MYTIKETLKPITDKYDEFLNGSYLTNLLKFKGQQEVGADYISKVFRAKGQEIRSKYDNAVQQVQNPTYGSFVKDNAFRIIALNGKKLTDVVVERLIVAYQTAPSLNRINRPNTLSFLFTEIMNDGAFRGSLRGLFANFAQTSFVLWPTILLTNKAEGGLGHFLATFTVLDALLYPLDTIKSRMYANTAVPLRLRDATANFEGQGLYSGILPKLAFNIPYLSAVFLTAQGSDSAWLAWLATAVLYPLNTMKAIQQTANSSSLGSPSYRGVVPFILVNYFFTHQITALFTISRLEKLKGEVIHESIEKLGYA